MRMEELIFRFLDELGGIGQREFRRPFFTPQVLNELSAPGVSQLPAQKILAGGWLLNQRCPCYITMSRGYGGVTYRSSAVMRVCDSAGREEEVVEF